MIKLFSVAFMLLSALFFAGCNSGEQAAAKMGKKESAETTGATITSMKTILFFGNSLTAGLGLEPAESFPLLIQQKIDSAKLAYKTVNAGVSGETSSGGNGRIDWILKQPVDVFVLELGANDGLRGIPVAETRTNLQGIIDKVKKKYPQVKLVLAGMQVPPNMGQEYSINFKNLFAELAKKNNMELIPFLLQGVAGIKELNQEDGIHPTADGEKIVADNVWSILQGVL